jgi:hypothetical protein
MKPRLILICVLLGLPLFAEAKTYYVGVTNCRDSYTSRQAQSSSTPWCTINHADSVVVAGDTVRVLSGTYTAAVSTTKSGTPGARIVYASDVKWGAKLVIAGNPDSCFYGTGSYVDYIGFDITENPDTGSCRIGLRVTGSHTTVQQNRVHDLNRNSAIRDCDNSGGAGILVSSQNAGSDTALVDSNLVDNIGGQAPGFAAHTCHYTHNFYLSMSSLTVTNNISLRAESQGYSFGGHPGQTVSNTVVVNNAAINNGFTGFYLSSDSGTDVVHNNIVDQRTCCIDGFESIYTAATTIMSNNLVYMPNGGRPYNNCARGCTVSNSLSGNPLFVNYTGDATGDYHLQASAPAISSGISNRAPNHDNDGNSRPQGSSWDIGPYEFMGAPSKPNPATAVVR